MGAAEDWLRSRQQDVQAHAAQTLEYDWWAGGRGRRSAGLAAGPESVRACAATRMAAAGLSCSAGLLRERLPAPLGPFCGRQELHQSHLTFRLELCRTFTTSYTGTVGTAGSAGGDDSSSSAGGSAADPVAAGPAAAGSEGGQDQGRQQQACGSARWEGGAEAIPRALLTSRDPILYYDELPLYESELDDHGLSRVTLKARLPEAAGLGCGGAVGHCCLACCCEPLIRVMLL